jgi:hypothetical protein
MTREMPLTVALSLPKSVYELLGLLSSRGGRIVDTEIPGHLRNALHICRPEPPLIVPVPVVGAIPVTKRPTIWKLTPEGEAVLALHLETEAESAPPEAESSEQPPPPKEPPPPRLTIDLARMGAILDGVFMDCNSEQALRLLQVYADHPGVWISSTELKGFDAELDGAKPHVLKKLLPPKIRSLIKSNPRKGSRLTFPGAVQP